VRSKTVRSYTVEMFATCWMKTALMLKIALLFVATAIAEIVGCFLPYLWLRKQGSIWLLLPAALSLALFVWLLTLHPAASGRVYAAYGGVYVATALVWLRFVDGVRLSTLDWAGAAIALFGMAIIVTGWSKGS
jgi:small multidrug resistance family-3 protein